MLAIFLQRAAVALAGFVVGGWAATALFPVHLAHHPSLPGLLIYLLGGVLAALLALRLFEAALVVLSAFGGAALIVDALGGAQHHQGLGGLEAPLLLGLALLGVIVQAGLTAQRSAPRRT